MQARLFDETIEQLKNPRLGHGPRTVGLLSKAIMEQNGSSSPKLACFDPHGQPILEP